MSWPDRLSPIRFSITATSSAIRLPSTPFAIRRGMEKLVGDTSACNSIRMGRVPSRLATTTEPVAFCGRSDKNHADGLATSCRPASVISKTPISLVDPNRFLTARRIRYAWLFSPSKYSTVSTMCSSVLGPAIAPSLVTCPMRKTGVPLRFA